MNPANHPPNLPGESEQELSTRRIQKWGALASFLLAGAFIVPSLIYLMGNLRSTFGPFSYDLADFLFGPFWAACLVMAFSALRERLVEAAPRRMSLALLAAILSAAMMVLVASIRSANRHYHLLHPELSLENASDVLVVWTTLLAGLTAAGFNFLGWAFLLVGSAGWSSGQLPKALCVFLGIAGLLSLFVYISPNLLEAALLPCLIVSIWQGIVLWKE
jgi:hypothetical protein